MNRMNVLMFGKKTILKRNKQLDILYVIIEQSLSYLIEFR